MLIFERFIARGNFNIQDFFSAAGITSDEELRAYCAEKNMTAPINEYFASPKVADNVVEKKTAKKPTIKKKPVATKALVEDNEKPVPKKTTRKPRTPRKRAPKKTQDKRYF